MSISGSLVGYEQNSTLGLSNGGNNNNGGTGGGNNISSSHNVGNNTSHSILNSSVGSIGKTCPSLNSSIVTAGSNATQLQQQHPNHHQQLPNGGKYQNSKRKSNKKMIKQQQYLQQQQTKEQKSYLHLNSLWSIWYGVLFTLFQGYLAVHGAYRFLGESIIYFREKF